MVSLIYYLLPPVMRYAVMLIAVTVFPSIWLMKKVYQSDHLEKEDTGLLIRLALFGVLSSLLSMAAELILTWLLRRLLPPESAAFKIILYFGIIAGSEELFKYLFLRRKTWNDPEFNCLYDGVVYAVFVSLGFALCENVFYAISYGITAIFARALTAIPGHACFGIYMGVFYGIAKRYDKAGNDAQAKRFGRLAPAVPILLHGAYDYIAAAGTVTAARIFLIYIAVLFIVTFIRIKKVSGNDEYF